MQAETAATHFERIGGADVVRELVHHFYQTMDQLPEAWGIRECLWSRGCKGRPGSWIIRCPVYGCAGNGLGSGCCVFAGGIWLGARGSKDTAVTLPVSDVGHVSLLSWPCS